MSNPKPTETLSIENVVASAGIDQELDLEQLAGDISQTEFNPGQFPGLLYRTENPETTVLIFPSGKMVCTGATSQADAQTAFENVSQQISSLGITTHGGPEFSVENLVVSGELGEEVNLNAAAVGFGLGNVEYEPEQFPGLVYRVDDSSAVVMLFGTGRTIVIGGKSLEEAEKAVQTVHTQLGEFGLVSQ
jgi:transcription initiation factor TFIID TATA-box-binding protein